MSTQVVRITIVDAPELATSIENECNVRAAAGYHLASTVQSGSELILIFQQ
jgi:hypothetical protein